MVDPVFFEAFLDLSGKLAGRFENERARHAGAGAAVLELGEHGKHERRRFSGSGLGNAKHVAPGKNVRDRLFLDRCRLHVSRGSYRCKHFVGQAEIRKRHQASKSHSPVPTTAPEFEQMRILCEWAANRYEPAVARNIGVSDGKSMAEPSAGTKDSQTLCLADARMMHASRAKPSLSTEQAEPIPAQPCPNSATAV